MCLKITVCLQEDHLLRLTLITLIGSDCSDSTCTLRLLRLSCRLLCYASCSRLPLGFRLEGQMMMGWMIASTRRAKTRTDMLPQGPTEPVRPLRLCVTHLLLLFGHTLCLCCGLPQLKQPSSPGAAPHGWSGSAQRPQLWQWLHADEEKYTHIHVNVTVTGNNNNINNNESMCIWSVNEHTWLHTFFTRRAVFPFTAVLKITKNENVNAMDSP